MYRHKPGGGFTLIELMIAMLIGMFLLFGATSLFISNKRIYKEQDAMGRLQENARFAMQILIGDIRSAGFIGCADDISVINSAYSSDWKTLANYDARNLIEGANDGSRTWYPSGWQVTASTTLVLGTDGITLRFFKPLGINLSGPSTSALVPVSITPGDIPIDFPLAVYDCRSADIFPARRHVIAGLQHQDKITGSYDTDAEIARVHNVRYYVRAGNDADGDGVNDPALWRLEALESGGRNLELIQGVENMQILYGIDNDGDGLPDDYNDADDFLTPPNETWTMNVVAVKLALLFRTITQNYSLEPDTKTYDLLGTTVAAANDFHRRRVVTATVHIRNRAVN